MGSINQKSSYGNFGGTAEIHRFSAGAINCAPLKSGKYEKERRTKVLIEAIIKQEILAQKTRNFSAFAHNVICWEN